MSQPKVSWTGVTPTKKRSWTISAPKYRTSNSTEQNPSTEQSAWLDHLRNWENDSFVRDHSKKLKADDNVYILRTSDDIRVFFRLEKDRIIVLDLATKATIVSFGQMTGTGS